MNNIKKFFVVLVSFIFLTTSCSTSIAQDDLSSYTITKKPCPRSKVNTVVNDKLCIKNGKVYRWATKNVKVEPEIIKPTTITAPDNKQKVDISGISINYIISDNALNRDYKLYLSALEHAIEFWYPVFNKSEINVVLFTENDSVWIDETQRRLMKNFFYNPEIDFQSYRLKQYGCNIGGFYLPNIILACVRESQYNNLEASMIIAHEYVHLVGMTSMQLSNFPLGSLGRLRPCWVEEGMAVFYGMKSSSTVDKNFASNKERFLSSLSSRITTDLRSEQSILKTMQELEENMTSCKKVQDAYFLGSSAFEILYNKYGHDKVIEFNKMFFMGVEWKSAFYKAFGISVNDFYKNLAQEVVKN